MLPSQELALIYEKQLRTVSEEVINLFRRFIKVSPVATVETSGYTGGSFKAAWEIKQNHDTSWTISNDMEYATILFDGRRFVVDRWFGSEQWLKKDNGQVMLEKFNRVLEKKLNKIKV